MERIELGLHDTKRNGDLFSGTKQQVLVECYEQGHTKSRIIFSDSDESHVYEVFGE